MRKGVIVLVPFPFTDSVIKLDHLATLQKKIVLGELGMAESPLIKEVDNKLKTLFGL